MPELPEVETTRASLQPLQGSKVDKVETFHHKLRWPIPEDLSILEGYFLKTINRRAKYLILEFSPSNYTTSNYTKNNSITDTSSKKKNSSNNISIIVHLGMSGSLQQFPNGYAKRKHDHLIFNFHDTDNENSELIQLHYHDPRRFGAVLWFHDYSNKLFDHLGVEPLDEMFSGEYLYDCIHRISENKRRKKDGKRPLNPINRPIKAVIMDQAFVVGVGNIYATESLFLSKIHPNTLAYKLTIEQLNVLANHINQILKRAIAKGGTTLRDFTVANGTTGYFQQTLDVYGKHNEPCPSCGTTIEKTIISGRASAFCPNCQSLY